MNWEDLSREMNANCYISEPMDITQFFKVVADNRGDRVLLRANLAPAGAQDYQGAWQPIESCVKARTDAEFTHGICPEFAKQYFPSDGGKT